MLDTPTLDLQRREIARACANLLRDLADACEAIASDDPAARAAARSLLGDHTDVSGGRIVIGDSECDPARLIEE